MKPRPIEVILETATASVLAFLSLPRDQRELLAAQSLNLAAKLARHGATKLWVLAIRAENRAERMVAP